MNKVTNCNNQTFFVGQRVKSNDGWIGTIVKISNRCLVTLYVNPDDINDVPEYQRWNLNPEAAKMSGKLNYCEPRDAGQSMGNFSPF